MAEREVEDALYKEGEIFEAEAAYAAQNERDGNAPYGAGKAGGKSAIEGDVYAGDAAPYNPAQMEVEEDHQPESTGCFGAINRAVRKVFPYGGLAANCFSLASVTLGGGIMGMPNAFQTSGLIMSLIYLVVMTSLSVYTYYILGLVMVKTGCRSLEQMGRLFFGPAGGYFVGFVLLLSCTGIAIAYISAIDSVVKPICDEAPNTPEFLLTRNGRRCLQVLVWATCMVPVVLPKHVSSIRYVSLVGVFFVCYFSVCIVVHSSMNGLQLGMRDGMAYFTTGNRAIYGLGTFIFSYINQGVSCAIYYEMTPRPSVRMLTLASAIAMSVCFVFYTCAGVFGYFDFADHIQSPVLYNYKPIEDPYMMVAFIGMLVKIVAAFAMNMIPIKMFILYVIRHDIETVPYWIHTVIVVTMSILVLLAGMFIPSINVAFGLVGSLCGGFIAFIFPALFWMFAGNWSLRTVGPIHYAVTHLLLVVGIIAIVWGTIATIYSSFIE